MQARRSLIEKPPHPSMGALTGHAQFGRDMRDRPAAPDNAIDQQLPTMNRQTSISVRHEDLRALVKTSDISTKPGGPPH